MSYFDVSLIIYHGFLKHTELKQLLTLYPNIDVKILYHKGFLCYLTVTTTWSDQYSVWPRHNIIFSVFLGIFWQTYLSSPLTILFRVFILSLLPLQNFHTPPPCTNSNYLFLRLKSLPANLISFKFSPSQTTGLFSLSSGIPAKPCKLPVVIDFLFNP